MAGLRFAEWYYGGPYARVSDPDGDLPRREPGHSVAPETQSQVERDGRFHGERVVAPFGDGNTIEDILGELFLASGYPDEWDDEERYIYPTIQGVLAEVGDRLSEKARRSPRRQAAWLREALQQVAAAAAAFRVGEYSAGALAVQSAMETVRDSKRVVRRRRVIPVGPAVGSIED